MLGKILSKFGCAKGNYTEPLCVKNVSVEVYQFVSIEFGLSTLRCVKDETETEWHIRYDVYDNSHVYEGDDTLCQGFINAFYSKHTSFGKPSAVIASHFWKWEGRVSN